ncbi:universal stress protein [Loktanella agnita]|uniref:universal stress protein n=1 Tax=Loktanella agnita TaxID=287097 RepID=UPI003986DA27
MFSKIMVPVDLAHREKLRAAIDVTAELARTYGAEVCYVGVTTSAPSSVAHTPDEYGAKLAAFAQEQAAAHGETASSHVIVSHDPTADLDRDLVKAVTEVGADLVVMATHVPSVTDLIWPSNGGRLATHTDVSVFLVRADAAK